MAVDEHTPGTQDKDANCGCHRTDVLKQKIVFKIKVIVDFQLVIVLWYFLTSPVLSAGDACNLWFPKLIAITWAFVLHM
jgi:hypothetical protein